MTHPKKLRPFDLKHQANDRLDPISLIFLARIDRPDTLIITSATGGSPFHSMNQDTKAVSSCNNSSCRRNHFLLLAMSCFSLLPGAQASTNPSSSKRLTIESMNKNLLRMEYAVRGPVVIAADKISDELDRARTVIRKARTVFASMFPILFNNAMTTYQVVRSTFS
jgi:hypothetical protein